MIRTAMEDNEARRERAVEAYRRENRFRAMVQHIVHFALTERWKDHDRMSVDRRDIARLAEDVAAQTLQMVYEEDAEIARLTAERDAYKKLAEETISIRPPSYFIPAPSQ